MKKPSVKPIRESKENRSVRKGRAVFPSEYFKCLLFLIVFGAFLFRCIVAFQLIAADPAAYAPSSITDMATYCALADAVLSGNLPDTFYYQPFYYSVFLPLCRLFTTSPHVLAVVQSLLGAAVVYGAGLIGAKIFGRRAGLWSALLCALSAILIYFTPYALLETVQSFWILFLFFALQAALRKKRLFLWCGAGLLLGFSILTRGNTWCFLPVVFCAVFYVERRNWKKALLPLLLFIVFTLLPQLPFAAYNTFKTGKLSGPSTAGGAVLCIGNNPESAPGGLDIPYPPTYEAWMKDEKKISVPARMLDWFLREPAAFLELQFNKFLLFWDSTEWPNNISEYNACKSSLMRTFRFPADRIPDYAGAGGRLQRLLPPDVSAAERVSAAVGIHSVLCAFRERVLYSRTFQAAGHSSAVRQRRCVSCAVSAAHEDAEVFPLFPDIAARRRLCLFCLSRLFNGL